MSQIAPILPLYIKQLGVYDSAAIAQFSGIAFGITFVLSAIFSPYGERLPTDGEENRCFFERVWAWL
ncbi:hypothetical protein ACWIE6_27670 [Paenibacillus taichungensis]|uniref:hypothetical protein n=1 Tax=Paenibacillus taichungensis TaxID=484184 RepID=UPI0035DC2A2C